MQSSKTVKLCAIVLNYFGCKDTVPCVKSLLGQPLDRICVVENSGDPAELKNLQDALGGQVQVEIVQTGENLGFAGGVNFGLRSMLPLGFDGFVILNNDTVLPPDLMQNLIKGAEDRALDLASPVIYRYPDQHILWSQGNYYNAWTGILGAGRIPGSIFYLPGCCLLVRRRVFESIGLFDQAFFMYGEDVEFCHRAAQGGFRIGTVPEALIYHKTGAASVQNSLFYEMQVNRGHLLLARKLFGYEPAQLAALCIKQPVLFLRACVRTIRFKNWNALRGYLSALMNHCIR